MDKITTEHINTLGNFCGMRDLEELSPDSLQSKYGFPQADVFVLFGGSILCGGDVLAKAMRDNIAKKYIIVGGAGHTTETLRQKVHHLYPSILTDGLLESEIFNQYISMKYGLTADYLERSSTNCGNNITLLLDLVHRENIPCRSIILCQDATMQRRMDAGLRKYAPHGMKIINYASYHADVVTENNRLFYSSDILGMWEIDRYISLLMGEIPRLTDAPGGYGPSGKDFIAHVDIPETVLFSFHELEKIYGGQIREANPLYASQH